MTAIKFDRSRSTVFLPAPLLPASKGSKSVIPLSGLQQQLTTIHTSELIFAQIVQASTFPFPFFFFLERLSIILRLYLERVERDFRNASTWKEEVLIPPSDNLNPSYFYRNWTLSLSFVQPNIVNYKDF